MAQSAQSVFSIRLVHAFYCSRAAIKQRRQLCCVFCMPWRHNMLCNTRIFAKMPCKWWLRAIASRLAFRLVWYNLGSPCAPEIHLGGAQNKFESLQVDHNTKYTHGRSAVMLIPIYVTWCADLWLWPIRFLSPHARPPPQQQWTRRKSFSPLASHHTHGISFARSQNCMRYTGSDLISIKVHVWYTAEDLREANDLWLWPCVA